MQREHYLVRVSRALSGKSQEAMGEETGIHPSLIARFELGQAVPTPEQTKRLARAAGFSVEDLEEIFLFANSLRQPRSKRSRPPQGLVEDFVESMIDQLRPQLESAGRRVLMLTEPEPPPPRAEDRQTAAAVWDRLMSCPEDLRFAMIEVSATFQSWALCEKACAEAAQAVAFDLEAAATYARLAEAIAEQVSGPQEWRNRVQAYAMAHRVNVLRAAGESAEAESGFEQARRLWQAGADPDRLLDFGSLLEPEVS